MDNAVCRGRRCIDSDQSHPTYRILIAPARFRASSASHPSASTGLTSSGDAYLSVLQLLLVARNQVPDVSDVVAPLYPASGQSECERPKQTPKEQQVVESEERNFNLEQKKSV